MKKALSLIFRILLGLFFLTSCVSTHLQAKSVYYAKHMPHGEDQHPEIIMLIDNLDWVCTPDIDGLRFEIDGTRDVINTKNKGEAFGNIYAEETEYIYDDVDGMSYRFNRRFELTDVYKDSRGVDGYDVDKDEIVSKIKSFLQPVIDRQSAPLIKLQWLFNLIHQRDFQ